MSVTSRAGDRRPGGRRPHAPAHAALAAALVVLAGLYSLNTPIFEGPDEIWHFAFADHLAEGGGLPVLDADNPNLLLRNAAHPPLYYIPVAALIAPIDRSDFPTGFRFNLASPHITPGSRSDRPNLLIHTGAEDFPFRRTTLAVHLGRLVSIAFGALTVWFTWAAARRLAPGLAPWATALAAGVPQFVYGVGLINNDALAAAAGAGTLAALVALMQTGQARWVFLAGLGLGAALLAKIGMVSLLPLPALAMGLAAAWPAAWAIEQPPSGQARLRLALARMAGVYGVAVLVAGWWYLRNWRLYGDPLAWREWQALAGVGRPAVSVGQFLADLLGLFGTFWADFGLRVDRQWVWGFLALVFLASVGWGRRLVRRDWPPLYWPGLALAAGMFLLLLASAVRYGLVVTEIHGRLLHPALPVIGVVVAVGLSGFGPRPGRWLLIAATAGLWGVSAVVPIALIRPAFAGPVVAGGQMPSGAVAAETVFDGRVRLVGHSPLPARARPGEIMRVTTYWRVDAAFGPEALPDLSAVIALIRPDGRAVGRGEARLGTSLYPSSAWQPGELVVTDLSILVDEPLALPALAAVALGVRAETADLWPVSPGQDSVTLGHIALSPPATCSPQVPTRVDFGEQIRLVGYSFGANTLTLCWQALRVPADNYTVLVHVADAVGNPLAGADGPPVGGQYPTRAWAPGEWVTDQRPLSLPPGATVQVGLYVLATGERLPVDSTAETVFQLPR